MSERCSNEIRIVGQGVQDCLEFCIRHDGKGQLLFDFNAIIPMPKSLHGILAGYPLEAGLILLGHRTHFVQEYLSYEWVQSESVTDAEGIKALLRKRYPEAEDIGRRALAARQQTGFTNCTEWRLNRWGNKSNAMGTIVEQVDPETVIIRFATVWQPPLKVVLELSNKFQELEFLLEYEKSAVRFFGTYECAGGEEIINEWQDYPDDGDIEEVDDEALGVEAAS
jgi:hypothetical protein